MFDLRIRVFRAKNRSFLIPVTSTVAASVNMFPYCVPGKSSCRLATTVNFQVLS